MHIYTMTIDCSLWFTISQPNLIFFLFSMDYSHLKHNNFLILKLSHHTSNIKMTMEHFLNLSTIKFPLCLHHRSVVFKLFGSRHPERDKKFSRHTQANFNKKNCKISSCWKKFAAPFKFLTAPQSAAAHSLKTTAVP